MGSRLSLALSLKLHPCWASLTEDEMVGEHHRFNGHELGQTPGDGEGQRPVVLQSVGLQSQTQLSN